MRRLLTIAVITMLIATGCAPQPQPAATPAGTVPASPPTTEAVLYAQVLRRYLTTSTENSFPGKTFTTVYVLDTVRSDAGSPTGGGTHAGAPLPPDVKAHLTTALAPTSVTFVAERNSVLDTTGGCAEVRNGGILITLGTVDGDDKRATVGLNGFVACLGATWLTYVVQHRTGTGWEVTGTTGPMAVA